MDKTTSRLAIPVFRSRVAPVLNWCSTIHIFPEGTIDAGSCQEILLLNMDAFERLRVLREEGVQTLICGALSPDLLNYGELIGLMIIHGIAGEIGEVLRAYHARQLNHPRFSLPGCEGRCGYRRGQMGDGGEVRGSCGRPAARKAAAGRKKSQDRSSAGTEQPQGVGSGPGGCCVCPRCGTRVRHKRGIPCSQLTCPQCQQPMVRG